LSILKSRQIQSSLSPLGRIVVLEPAGDVVDRVVAFRRSIYRGVLNCPMVKRGEEETPESAEPA